MDALFSLNLAHPLSLKKKTADFKKACILTTYHFQAVKNLPKSVHSIGNITAQKSLGKEVEVDSKVKTNLRQI